MVVSNAIKGESMPDFHGVVAVVTGGGHGLGQGICHKLAEYGAAVAVTDIDIEAARTVAETLAQAGHRARAYRHDVTSWDESHRVVSQIENELDEIGVLVCNAGVSRSIAFLEIDEAEWDRVVDINLKGLFITLRTVVPGMVQRRAGRVVVIASISSKQAYPRFAHYNASKFGALGLVQTVAAEVAAHNVTLNTVLPGVMQTPMQRQLVEQMLKRNGGEFETAEDAEAWFNTQLPLGAPQPVEDVAEMVAYLGSDLGRHMTAGSYHVDGGMAPR
jgi:NAD(P)-dependent dehydrogenase (short-subunit alcohol dehydrogenase family)